ncbi:TPA: 50S ribosomal protein L18e [archaeon]|uniref:Large ribosomal subunit protein eL18 n=1 Tax=Candidatus Naiadarchaeum limnaeum TaxID=2756139 RepID=A0A832V408_9ARCH|nr:50S ribosomal protein L18e [Candidatus Naiadarchaeum limnaeum]
MKRRKAVKTNPRIRILSKKLEMVSKKQKAEIWKTIARALEGPAQNWAEVNIEKLDRLTKEKEVVVVPGKVLGSGSLTHSVEVYAFNSSAGAKKSIQSARGKIGTIEELIEKNPKGTGVRIIR